MMKEEAQSLPSARWSWSAIALFLVACATGPAVTWWAQPHSGDESMATAINGAIASGCVFALGVPFAIAALLKERRRRILTGITSVLYGVPLLVLLFLSLVYLANR
jgi:ABC-type proline/glycine betaine transport system permease subunit